MRSLRNNAVGISGSRLARKHLAASPNNFIHGAYDFSRSYLKASPLSSLLVPMTASLLVENLLLEPYSAGFVSLRSLAILRAAQTANRLRLKRSMPKGTINVKSFLVCAWPVQL